MRSCVTVCMSPYALTERPPRKSVMMIYDAVYLNGRGHNMGETLDYLEHERLDDDAERAPVFGETMPRHPTLNKNHRFVLNLTQAQYERIETAANKAGVSQNEYIRQKLGVN